MRVGQPGSSALFVPGSPHMRHCIADEQRDLHRLFDPQELAKVRFLPMGRFLGFEEEAWTRDPGYYLMRTSGRT